MIHIQITEQGSDSFSSDGVALVSFVADEDSVTITIRNGYGRESSIQVDRRDFLATVEAIRMM